MFAIAQAPAKQNATDAISVLSGRLQSGTLLEDRRNAILGLRSFARQYPASVASGALRGLISSLSKDVEDVDTVKIVLETLLMLFNPDENSPEASEEIALWLADEFTQRQENITMLLDLLDANEVYSRLYSLQLLAAILSSRTQRTEECIFVAPLGISRLTAVLDDKREAVRNEGLALLTYLTPSSTELQKLVAFENAFDRIFKIVTQEGSLSNGDRVVEDCLILLANLLRMNVSNQSFFRETGCIPKLAGLLKDFVKDQNSTEALADWVQVQRNRNVYASLAVVRLFLVSGAAGTPANQASFWQHGLTAAVLQLAFHRATENQIRAEALVTCADLIRGAADLQERFAQFQVTSTAPEIGTSINGIKPTAISKQIHVIDGLLELCLNEPSLLAFDTRVAACECIKAYFQDHPAIRLHFLRRAIEGHMSGADETANVLTTLLVPDTDINAKDPYRTWIASVLMFQLLFENTEGKALAMAVVEGDATKGEEVVTCIQSLASNLVVCLQGNEDDRVIIGYLMLLCGWLFEDPDAVNDFLGEGSNVQGLVQAANYSNPASDIVKGLCALLLGIVYEFSTKDSPVPRSTIHPILNSRLGREPYIDRLTKLRRAPEFRDFEVLPQKLSTSSSGGLPEVFFDKTFVEFAKDNFSRIVRAIDREPGLEVSVSANGIQKGISRELVDTLRAQVEDKDKAFLELQGHVISLERRFDQEKADHRRARESATIDISRIKSVNEALQRNHEEEISQLQNTHKTAQDDLQRQLLHVQKTSEGEAERIRRRTAADIADLKATVSSLEAELTKTNKNHMQDLQTANDEYLINSNAQKARLERAEEKAKDLETSTRAALEAREKAAAALAEKESQRAAVQGELDDLLMVFADLEEKVATYQKRLKAMGESVSDGEDNEDDAALDEEESREEETEEAA